MTTRITPMQSPELAANLLADFLADKNNSIMASAIRLEKNSDYVVDFYFRDFFGDGKTYMFELTQRNHIQFRDELVRRIHQTPSHLAAFFHDTMTYFDVLHDAVVWNVYLNTIHAAHQEFSLENILQRYIEKNLRGSLEPSARMNALNHRLIIQNPQEDIITVSTDHAHFQKVSGIVQQFIRTFGNTSGKVYGFDIQVKEI